MSPGPWQLNLAYLDKPPYFIESQTNGSVAAVNTSKDDARLIAAAPELLAALEMVAEQIRHQSPDEPCRQAIGRAIIKARGRGVGALLSELRT